MKEFGERNERTTWCFFQLLRYSIGASGVFPENLTEGEWEALFDMAQQQALLGVLFHGIQKNLQQKPPRDLLLKWYVVSEQIKATNQKANKVSVELSDYFRAHGFRSCILKGQGNTLNYPNPYIRTSGDMDVWVSPFHISQRGGMKQCGGKGMNLNTDENVREMIAFARERHLNAKALYHHVDVGTFQGVEVEIHYRPSFMNNLIHNRRLQWWFELVKEEQFSHNVAFPDDTGSVCIPTHAFNRVYQMSHIFRHVIQMGIGLRQITDYYFVLKQGFTPEEQKRDIILLKQLGLYRIATALMWVLKEVLRIEDKYMLVPADRQRGEFLLNEIIQGGNFGQWNNGKRKKQEGRVMKNIQRIKRDFRLMWYFPSECLWEPIFRWYHFFWRWAHR
ncbi:MAG: nucleotidyltransferase family protein [Bacteroidaceae bacterium]|nr:nucleotidyltransferase family protein [Bacteroidaceae bacterium]